MANTFVARDVKSAKDCHGRRVRVGSQVVYVGYGEGIALAPLPVTVTRIQRQGADGTILSTDGPPNRDYPHHKSCRASVVRMVAA